MHRLVSTVKVVWLVIAIALTVMFVGEVSAFIEFRASRNHSPSVRPATIAGIRAAVVWIGWHIAWSPNVIGAARLYSTLAWKVLAFACVPLALLGEAATASIGQTSFRWTPWVTSIVGSAILAFAVSRVLRRIESQRSPANPS